MKQAMLVFLGGGIGSVLRYFMAKWLNPVWQNFYLGTFSVNIIGSLFIGMAIGYLLKHAMLDSIWQYLFIVGFCGGFTTFSSFAFENYSLIQGQLSGSLLIYTIGSVVLGIVAVFLGIYLGKTL